MQSRRSLIIGYPPTWVAVLVVVAAVWLLLTWFSPPLLVGVVIVLLGLVFLVGWVWTMSATGTIDHLQIMKSLTADEDVEALALLEDDLAQMGGEQALTQLRLLRSKKDNLAEVLKRRMDAGELTYSRYLGSAQKVYETALRNLSEVAVALRSVSTIDVEYIDDQLTRLREADSTAEDTALLTDALEQRRMLEGTQRERATALLAQNEQAMTVLDKTATALADLPIGKKQSAEADQAIEQLEELAARAGKYFEM